MYVRIGGIDQWIQIRGEDRGNPVILFVHGGPGDSTIPTSSAWQPWEKFFTVVQWDQRGAGRTYRINGESIAPTMTMAQMTQDSIELAEYLREHLHKERIILVGHSWGSYLGIHIVKRRPELFHAFVGTGQLIGKQSFEKQFEITVAHLKALAQAANNAQAVSELAPISAAPDFSKTPCDTISFSAPPRIARECEIVQKWAKALSLPSIETYQFRGPVPPPFMPDFSLLDWYYLWKGSAFSAAQLRRASGPMLQVDLWSLGTDFSIPMFLFEGAEDPMTPIEPARAWFEQIKAPRKEFVLFKGGDHFIPFDQPDEFPGTADRACSAAGALAELRSTCCAPRVSHRTPGIASAPAFRSGAKNSEGRNAMEKPRVQIYTDYKSPYAFVANKRLFELADKHGVELEWLPYTLRVAEFMGTVEERTPHFWRKVRYAYMDARRYANAQGLTMKGPRQIYDAFYSSVGMLFSQHHGFFRAYHDTVFRRFWSHDLEIDDFAGVADVIASVGGSPEDFKAYVEGPARAEHDRIIEEAEALGVFGVPTMVFNGELFWGGDRIDMLIERIKNPEGIAAALGSRHRKQGVRASRQPAAASSRCAQGSAARRRDPDRRERRTCCAVAAGISPDI